MERINQGPSLEAVSGDRLDSRRSQPADTVLIIPTYRKKEVLRQHLSRLRGQIGKNFDIMIIYGEGEGFESGFPDLSILHVSERGKNGCAGSFYIGEKLALREGYRRIILSDDDCLPLSDSLIKDLTNAIDAGLDIAMPHIKLKEGSAKHWLISHYACMRSEVLRKAGLTFLPFYFGGEDVEMLNRMRHLGFRLGHVGAEVFHGEMPSPMIDGTEKRYYYIKGGLQASILSGNLREMLQFSLFHLVSSAAFFSLGNPGMASLYLKGIGDGMGMVFYDSYRGEPKRDKQRCAQKPGAGDTVVKRDMSLNLDMLKNARGISAAAFMAGWLCTSSSYFLRFREFFGRRVFFNGRSDPVHMPILLMASDAYILAGGETLIIFEGRNAIQIIGGIILMAALSPLAALISPIPILIGAIKGRGIDTKGYGIGPDEIRIIGERAL